VGEGLAATGGEVAEHCVVMRRLEDGRDALSLLARGDLSSAHLDRLAARVVAFHRASGLGVPSPFEPGAWRHRCTDAVDDTYRLLASGSDEAVPRSLVDCARERAEAFARDAHDRFEARRLEGRAVDGHGDLHLQHVWFESDDAQPIIIDCLEFSERLRRIDSACDVAFTAMDLAYRGAGGLAEHFLREYAGERDDFGLYGVVDYFASYRAAVRAKVAAIAAADRGIDDAQRSAAAESAHRHLEWASWRLEPRPPGLLVLVSGVVGTGKSTVAEVLADALDGAVVATDRVRRHQSGLAPGERPDSAKRAQMYDASEKQRVYEGLLERAKPVVVSGRAAVLDGTFSRRVDRQRARRLAREWGTRAFLVEARCSAELALDRLARRAEQGDSLSDAGPERHGASVREFEAVDEWPAGERTTVDTGRDGWRDRLHELALDLRS
jgi:aminoglycoside phosphotransferase family enzyme/predicted kinase